MDKTVLAAVEFLIEKAFCQAKPLPIPALLNLRGDLPHFDRNTAGRRNTGVDIIKIDKISFDFL